MASPDLISGIFVAAFILAALAAIFLMVWWGRRSLLRRFAVLKEHYGFRHEVDRRGRTVPENLAGAWHGRPARVRFRHGGRGDPGTLSFILDCSVPVESAVHIRPRRWYDRLGTALGLVRHVAHGQGRFHNEAHVESDNDDLAERLAASRAFRNATLPLLSLPRPVVTVDASSIALSLRRCGARRRKRVLRLRTIDMIFHSLEAAAESLTSAQALPAITKEQEQSSASAATARAGRSYLGGGKWARGLIFTSALLLFLGPMVLWWGSRYPTLTWDLHLAGFAIGGALALLSAALAFGATRGRSRALADFSLFCFWAFVGFPTFVSGVLAVTNGMMDRSDPFVAWAVVTAKKETPSVRIAVLLPDGTAERQSIRVPSALYDTVRPGDRLPVELKPGFLSQPWLHGLARME